MIVSVVWDMGKDVVKKKDVTDILIMLAAFLASYQYGVNVIWIILAAASVGIVRTLLRERRHKAGQAQGEGDR